jgi:lipopolysaccharide transport system ATP-binding protein
MIHTIEFNNVSKVYRLGVTRDSVPTMISTWVKAMISRNERERHHKGQHWAVRNVSFSLSQGESLALVGANGAGKSTILKLLAKITKPTSGSLKINGSLSTLIELGAGFHPELTGRENIFLNGAILGIKNQEIKRRFDSIVDFSGLADFIDTPVKRFSSGMAVRLGFSIAASINPDVILVDEVLAVGDSIFQMKCMQRIQELINSGTTLIFVSHNMGLVKAVCKLGLYINRGNLEYFGNVNDAIDHYNRDLNKHRISSKTDLKNEDGSTFSDIAFIKMVKIEALNHEHPTTLKSNRPARLTICYHSYQDIKETSVVVRIVRSDGVSCCVMFSRQDNVHLPLSEGDGEITIDLDPLQLFPGSYHFLAALKNKDETVVFDHIYSDWFHVEGDAKGYEDLDGIYEPHRHWNQVNSA